ncbi:MAG: AraC family transcriptional regulator [Propionibacteriaceae bacterium]|nr:AraC family transcriptional regulator [Propionibacteriaceae bacterium]
MTLAGPATGASHRDLRGTGWAVGALLRPAGLASLCDEPHRIRNAELPFAAPDLHRAVTRAMTDEEEPTGRRQAVASYAGWALECLAPVDANGARANAMEELIAADPAVTNVGQVARQLSLSTRSVQRLARRYIGLTPLAVIRRYRLQEAAQRLRDDPSVTIAQVAAELGYADHAHLASDFRTVLGLTPNQYRRPSS